MLRVYSLSIVVLVICFHVSYGQSKRGNIGIFGNGVALDFNSNPVEVKVIPQNSPDYPFESLEGSASICDQDGNLLFYTNSIHVWNKNHQAMPNGRFIQELGGANVSTTTQCLIVPIPKDPFQYYIITAGYQGRDLKHTLVDIRLNNGLGDVVFKDSLIYKKTTEKMCVIKHSNGESLWLITHEFGTNKFRSHLIDEDGLHFNYVESATGITHAPSPDPNTTNGANAIGYMKASHDGKNIAVAIAGDIGTFEYFQFNNSTGEVYNGVELLPVSNRFSYGVEFSPDNSKLYLSNWRLELFQFDLLAGSASEVIHSKKLISNGVGGALQLGPDGNIYVDGRRRGDFADTLDVIRNPNASGVACDFQKNAIYLKNKAAFSGLPELIYNTVDPEILYNQYCNGKEITFQLVKIKQFNSIAWNFGNPQSGVLNQSAEISPHHTYKKAGRYRIHIDVSFADGSTFSYDQPITILQIPKVDLGKDTLICAGQSITLKPQTDSFVTGLKWNDGSTADSKSVKTVGKYWVTAYNQLCNAMDTITIGLLKPPTIQLSDTILCFDETLHVLLPEQYEYVWNDGVQLKERIIETAGLYTVNTANRCGTMSDHFNMSFAPRLNLNLVKDTVLCINQELVLNVTSDGGSYLWHDGSTEPQYKITEKGIYWVDVYNRCEELKDTVVVDYVSQKEFFIPNVITPNNDTKNDYFVLDEGFIRPDVTIFNRWGDLVYKNAQYNNDWPEEQFDSGMYYYYVNDVCYARDFKGWLQLLR